MPIEKVIEIGIQVGLRTALDAIQKEKEEKKRNRYDRRLRNTDLLMKNYKNFVVHCRNAVYTSRQIKQANAVDILDECEDMDDEVYIQSILKTKERTAIIVNHIKTILAFYKFRTSSEIEGKRRYNVITGYYIDGKTYQRLADEYNCSSKTIERDKKEAIEELSVLIFGIDGLKLEA